MSDVCDTERIEKTARRVAEDVYRDHSVRLYESLESLKSVFEASQKIMGESLHNIELALRDGAATFRAQEQRVIVLEEATERRVAMLEKAATDRLDKLEEVHSRLVWGVLGAVGLIGLSALVWVLKSMPEGAV